MKSLLKRSSVKRLACFLLAAIITVGFVPLPARAATAKHNYKIISLSQKKWITAKQDSYNKNTNTYTCYLYKITVPANSFIRVDSKSKSKIIRIFKSINMKDRPNNSDPIFDLDKKTLYRCVLPKGTYYIYADAGTTFKWRSFTTKNPTNFCRSRSVRLKAGYKKTEVFNIGYEFGRWYKISLTTKKPITVTMKQMDECAWGVTFSVFNSHGSDVNCKSVGNSLYRTAVLPKGTYYIQVDGGDFLDYHDFGNRICQFWWR